MKRIKLAVAAFIVTFSFSCRKEELQKNVKDTNQGNEIILSQTVQLSLIDGRLKFADIQAFRDFFEPDENNFDEDAYEQREEDLINDIMGLANYEPFTLNEFDQLNIPDTTDSNMTVELITKEDTAELIFYLVNENSVMQLSNHLIAFDFENRLAYISGYSEVWSDMESGSFADERIEQFSMDEELVTIIEVAENANDKIGVDPSPLCGESNAEARNRRQNPMFFGWVNIGGGQQAMGWLTIMTQYRKYGVYSKLQTKTRTYREWWLTGKNVYASRKINYNYSYKPKCRSSRGPYNNNVKCFSNTRGYATRVHYSSTRTLHEYWLQSRAISDCSSGFVNSWIQILDNG
jgi:hypothetical protein